MSALLEARRLTVGIGVRVLYAALDLRLQAGQSWAVLGPNGVGKSTLLSHLAGLAPGVNCSLYSSGDSLHRLTPRQRAQRIGLLLQHSDRGFGASVLDTVLTGRHPHLPRFAWEGRSDLAIARQSLADLDLATLTERPLDHLSGGELRRVDIARLLTQQPQVALLDEPLSHLDLGHQASCLKVLTARLVGEGRAMLMVLHDLNVAYRSCDHWLLLGRDGAWRSGRREQLADPEILQTVFDHPILRLDGPDGPWFQAQI